MIALTMVLRGRTMRFGRVFMMLSCFVMCVFCHVDLLWNRYFDSLNAVHVMNHWTSALRTWLGTSIRSWIIDVVARLETLARFSHRIGRRMRTTLLPAA